MRTTVILVLALVLLTNTVSAQYYGSHNVLDPYLDRSDINWFDRDLYYSAIRILPCVDLDEFNAHADSNPFDRYNRDDIKDHLEQLSSVDFERVANQNRFDDIDSNRFDIRDAPRCSTREQFNIVANRQPAGAFDDDYYFQYYGYNDAREYQNVLRHDNWEVSYAYDEYPYRSYEFGNLDPTRVDTWGGLASWIPFW